MDFGFNADQEMLRATARKFLENECTSTFGMSDVQRAISSIRSATLKRGAFPSFSSTATRKRSKSRAPRRMMSRCPFVNGSNEPG